MMARYRAQPDLYRNPPSGLGMGVGSVQSIVGGSGILPNSTILPPPHSSSTVLPAIYDPHHLDHRYGQTTGWNHSFQTEKGRDYGPPAGERLSFSAGGGGGASSTHSSSVQTHPSTQQTVQPHQNTGTNQQHSQQHSQHSPHLGHVHPPHGSPQFTNDVQKQYATLDQQRQFSREHHQYNQFAGPGSERQHDAFPALSPSLPFPLNSRKEVSGSDFNNIDGFGSDGSVSSSAGSSNMQFPLMDRSRSRIFAFDTHDGVLGKEGLLGDGAGTGLVVGGIGEGGFSSAFGLMSLDDPNVLAGLATDGTPFFTKIEGENTSSLSKRSSVSEGAGSTTDASMSDKGSEDTSNTSLSSSNDNSANASTTSLGLGGNLATPGSREMREFWRQYMRTPLTGPGASTPLFGSLLTPTASGNHLQLGAGLADDGRPAPPSRRHSRVASLPSLKTPTSLGLSEYGIFVPINNNNASYTTHNQSQGLSSYLQPPTFQLNLGGATKKYKDSQQRQREHEQDTQPSPGQANHRGTIHDQEDLKSYEQAVLARRGVTELKIVPRRRGTVASGAPSASVNVNAYGVPLPISNRPSTADAATNSNRSASSTTSKGSTSSLAEAFGRSGSVSVVSVGESSRSSVSPPLSQSTIAASSSSQGSHGDRDSPTPSAGPRMDEHSPLLGAPSRVPAHYSSSHDNSFLPPAVSHQGTGDSQGSYRPSFKRLASQTLGPDNAKRALLGPAGWEEEDDVVDDEEESSEDEHYAERDRRTVVSQQAKFVQGSRPMRRMSCPTTARSPSSLVLPPIQAGGSVPGRSPSGAGYP